jgi:hypothetical protein
MSLTSSPDFRIHPALLCGGAFLLTALSFQGISQAEPPASPPETQTSGAVPVALPSSELATDIGVPSREAVEKAIERAQSYLQSRIEENHTKNKQDNWETAPASIAGDPGFRGARWGELTGLALVAQLSRPGYDRRTYETTLETFMRASIDSPTALAMRLRLCEFLPSARARTDARSQEQSAETNIDLLLKKATPDLADIGQVASSFKLSKRFDADVPDRYWQQTDAAWRKAQRPDGSWFDRDTDPPAVRVATTAKGVAALLLAQDALSSANTDCKERPPDTNLDAAMSWLDEHAGDALSDPEAMFALANAGTTSGRRMFGTINWYPRGVAELLKRQNADGSWPATPQLTGADATARLIPETAYSVLFLDAGLMPARILKLDYQLPPIANGGVVSDPGNRRPFDVAHFSEWAARELCTYDFMTWERVNCRMSPRDLSDSALLYISGSEPLSFTEKNQETLRTYVLHGGLILGNADCGSARFAESFMALGKQLFPGRSFRDLPPDHLIFTDFKKPQGGSSLKLIALGNDVREFMLLAPDSDFGKAWQAERSVSRRALFDLGVNILVYANGRAFLEGIRGQPAWPARNETIHADRTIRIARLLHAGNADPEPGGWERMAIVMHNDAHADLVVTPVQLGSGKLTAGDFQIAHLTGTGILSLSDADRGEIASFVKDGGTLIVDAAGGSPQFAESAAKELANMFPSAATSRPDAPAGDFGKQLGKDADFFNLKAAPIERFRFRKAAILNDMYGKGPKIQAMDIGSRHAVFFSALDLSNGIVGQDTDGIIGCDPETATAVMRNLLLYAAGER